MTPLSASLLFVLAATFIALYRESHAAAKYRVAWIDAKLALHHALKAQAALQAECERLEKKLTQ